MFISFKISNAHSATVLPSSLAWHDQVCVVTAEHPCENWEQKNKHHEEHPHSLAMVLVQHISFQLGFCVTAICRWVNKNLLPCLEKQEKPEFTVIQFAHTAPNPEAVMIELANTTLALTAVPRSERHKLLANLAKTLGWHQNSLIVLICFSCHCILGLSIISVPLPKWPISDAYPVFPILHSLISCCFNFIISHCVIRISLPNWPHFHA